MNDSTKVYLLGEPGCDQVAVWKLLKGKEDTIKEIRANADNDPDALNILPFFNSTPSIIVVDEQGNQHFLSYSDAPTLRLSRLDLQNPEVFGQLWKPRYGKFPSGNIVCKPSFHAPERLEDFLVLTFDFTIHRSGKFCFSSNGHIAVYCDSTLETVYLWLRQLREKAETLGGKVVDLEFCLSCGKTMELEDHRNYSWDTFCIACDLHKKTEWNRSESRKKALHNLNRQELAVKSGSRVEVRCSLCGEEFDIPKVRVGKQQNYFCTRKHAHFYQQYHSDSKSKYSPEFLRFCKGWTETKCAVPGCEVSKEETSQWHVCGKHQKAITLYLAKKNQDRLKVLKQHNLEAI